MEGEDAYEENAENYPLQESMVQDSLLAEPARYNRYRNADVFHCEVIDSVTDRFIEMRSIPEGSFDNVAACKYNIPDYWTIGAVYERLIEDVCDEITSENILAVYSSWISDAISNYNTDFYYQPRDYIKECYLAGKVL